MVPNLKWVLGSSCIFDRPALTQARRYTALGLVTLSRLRLQDRGGLADFMPRMLVGIRRRLRAITCSSLAC